MRAAELGLVGRITKVHARPPSLLCQQCQLRAVAAEQLGRQQGPPQVHVGHALPGVADAAVHLDGRLAHRAGAAGGVCLGDGGGCPASAGSSASTAQAAYNIALSAPSLSVLASASRCWTAWNEPIGNAVLATFPGIGGGQRERTLHHADEVGRGEGDGERLPRQEIVGRQRAVPSRSSRRGVDDEPAHRPGEIDAGVRAEAGIATSTTVVARTAEGERNGAARGIEGDARFRGRSRPRSEVTAMVRADPIVGRCAGAPQQVVCEQRSDERDVAGAACQALGPRERLRRPMQRLRRCPGAQFPPAGLVERRVEAAPTVSVVEIADRCRSELLDEAHRGVFELALLGSRSGIHRGRG